MQGMTMKEYAKSRGLTISLIAQKMGVSRQAISLYGIKFVPTAKTLEKTAKAMTELGAPTTAVDLFTALYTKEESQKAE